MTGGASARRRGFNSAARPVPITLVMWAPDKSRPPVSSDAGDATITTKMWSQVTGLGGDAPGEVASAATGLSTVRCLDLRGVSFPSGIAVAIDT